MRRLLFSSLFACTSHYAFAQEAADNEAPALPDPDAIAFTLNGKDYTFDYLIQFSTLLVDDPNSVEVISAYPVLTNIVADQELAAQAARDSGLDQTEDIQDAILLLTNSLLADAYMAQEVEKRLSEERIEAAYQTYIDNFTPSPLARASHILVESPDIAEDVIEQLEAGADFATLAKELSIGPSGPNGGSIGIFGLGQMPTPFEEVAFALTPGTFSTEPVQTEYGFHVIYLTELTETNPASVDSVRPDLIEILQQQLQAEIREELRVGTDLVVVPYDLLPKQ